MGQTEQLIQHVCGITEFKHARDWEERPVDLKTYYETPLPGNLGTHRAF